MLPKSLRVLSGIGLAVLLPCGAAPLWAQPSLGTAQSFAVLGGSAVTNTGLTLVTGDLGVSPSASVTGFTGAPDGTVTGTIHAANATSLQAQTDVTTQYNALAGASCSADLTGSDLGGMILEPGVYCFSSTAGLTGTLTLDAQGSADATFIFKVGSALTTASTSSVVMINGGNPCGVGWQIGTSATLGTGTQFIGNLIALASITLTTGADIVGRALARNGAVTMDTNNVSFALCGVPSAVPALPTLATWATIAMSVLLALAGYVTLRRRTPGRQVPL